MGSVPPGYAQHVVPAPHAAQGQAVQATDVKKSVQTPSVQTWSLAHAVPQLPEMSEQWSGLEPSSSSV
jgi:hypothetical protein